MTWFFIVILVALLSTAVPTQSITVHVTVYNDSDAYGEDQVRAYEDFLTWCEENGVKVAVFHYPECEFEAPGITSVIRDHLGKSVDFVGSHGTAHSIAGLPPDMERLQIEYSWEFFEEQDMGSGLRKDVVSPSIEWVIDENFVHVCRELGINWIVSGYRTWEFNPQVHPDWYGMDMDYLADVLVVKRLDIDGDVVYVCPVIDFGELVDDVEQDVGPYGLENLKEAFRRAVQTLLDVGAINESSHLVLWVLIHPWQLVERIKNTDKTGLDLIEEFIGWVKGGNLDFTLDDGIPVHLELEEPSKCLELVRDIAEHPDDYGHPLVTISELSWASMVHASDLLTAEGLEKDYPEVVKLWREGMDILKSIAPRLRGLKGTELDPLVRDVVLRTVNEAQLGCMCESEGIIQYLEVWKAGLELLRDYLDGSASLLTTSADDSHRILVFQYSDGGIAAVFLDRNWWRPSLGVVRGKVTLDRAGPTDLVVRGEFTSVGLSDITGGRIVVEDEKGDVIAEVPFTLDELESGVTISLPKDRRADTVYVVLSGNVQGRLWDQFQVDLSLPIPVPRASVSGTLSLIEKTPEGATLEVRYETHTVACTPERLVITLYDQSGEIVSQETIEYPPETGLVRFKVTGSGSYRAVLVLQCSSGLTTESVASELSTDVMEIVLPSVRIRASTDVQPGPEGATLRVDYDVDASHAEVDGVEVVLYDEDGYVVGKKEVSDLSGSVTFDVDKDGTYKILITARCRDADTGTQFSTTTETDVTVQIPRASVNGALSLVKKTPENAVLNAYYEINATACTPELLEIALYDENGNLVDRKVVNNPPKTGSVTFTVTGSGSYYAVMTLQCSIDSATEPVVSKLTTDAVAVVLPSVSVDVDARPTPESATLSVEYRVNVDRAEVDSVEIFLCDESGNVVGRKTLADPSGSVTFEVGREGTYRVLVTVHCRDADTGTSFSATAGTDVTVKLPRYQSHSPQSSAEGRTEGEFHTQSGARSATEEQRGQTIRSANRLQEQREGRPTTQPTTESSSSDRVFPPEKLQGRAEENVVEEKRSGGRTGGRSEERERLEETQSALQRGRPTSAEMEARIATVELTTAGRSFLIDVFENGTIRVTTEDGTVRTVKLPFNVKSVNRVTPTTLEVTLQNGRKVYLTVDERGRLFPQEVRDLGRRGEAALTGGYRSRSDLTGDPDRTPSPPLTLLLHVPDFFRPDGGVEPDGDGGGENPECESS